MGESSFKVGRIVIGRVGRVVLGQLYFGRVGLSIKNITGPDPAKFTESTEGSGPGLRNLSENDGLSEPVCSSGSGSNYKDPMGTENNYLLESKYYG